jgi:hypothetical protein
MQFLTPIYLTLMHAFADRAIERLDSNQYTWYGPEAKMDMFGTLRIDGGRQTGKTSAVAQFAAEWAAKGNDVIVMSTVSHRSREVAGLIKKISKANPQYDSPKPGFVTYDTVRSFLDEGNYHKYRGLSLTRLLIIIEEPMKLPSMDKFYSSYLKMVNQYMCQGDKPLPLFFVMGMQ